MGGTVWKTKFDLAGPTPPHSVTAGVGNTLIVVKWSESTDTDKAGYKFYCDPIPGSSSGQGLMIPFGGDASVDGGDGDEAGADAASDASGGTGGSAGAGGGSGGAGGGGTSSGGACPASALVEGTEPDPSFECGSGVGTSGTISGLVNGVSYTVAVAGFDSVRNVGKLSNVACATPSQVDDFFAVYRDAGGRAGGGFCTVVSVGGGTGGAGAAGLVLVAFCALGSMIRRRPNR